MSYQYEISQVSGQSYNYQSTEYPQIKLDSSPDYNEDEEILPLRDASKNLKILTYNEDIEERGLMPCTPLISSHDEKPSFGFSTPRNQDSYPTSHGEESQKKRKGIGRNVFLNCLGRYLITLSLCTGYVVVIMIWLNKTATGFFGKRVYNMITTGISIALGLNLSGSFREIALTMRWSLLALGRQNLEEVDLLLQANNLISFFKLAYISRRPLIKFGCFFWLSVNILTQFGLAMISLTYNFDDDPLAVRLRNGRAMIPRMNHFYPRSNHVGNGISLQDEQYTAHVYGEFALTFGIGLVSNQPIAGQRYRQTDPLLWIDKGNSLFEFIFLDTPMGSRVINSFSAFTERKIDVKYECNSFNVLSGGDGTASQIEVETVGTVYLSKAVPDSTTYLTRSNHTCKGDNRCSVVEVFESSTTEPWYYVCDISLGQTKNDPHGVSNISDTMAQIATASIAQTGYTDYKGFASQVYPRQSVWGQISSGESESIGMMIALYALASIAGAAQFNPFTSYATPLTPSQGFRLNLKHWRTFFSILALINITQLGFFVAAIVLSKRGKAIAYNFIDIIMLLKPITDKLPKFCLIEDGKESRKLKSEVYARYEKDVISKKGWNFKIHTK